MLTPQTHCLLISEPYLRDTSFYRSVLWVIEHTEQNTVALVLNNLDLGDISLPMAQTQLAVINGGPVDSDSIFCIHQHTNIADSVALGDGFYTGGNFHQLEQAMIQQPKKYLQFFAGYCGWGPNQLQHEIEHKSWLVAPFNKRVLQVPRSIMYKTALQTLGPQYAHYANAPSEIYLN